MTPPITSSNYIFQAWAVTLCDTVPLFIPFHSRIAVITADMLDQSRDIHLSLKDSIVVIASPLHSAKKVTIEGRIVILCFPIIASKIEVVVTRALLYQGKDSLDAADVTLNFAQTRPRFVSEFLFRKEEKALEAIETSASILALGSHTQNQGHDLEKGLKNLFNATLLQKNRDPKKVFDSEVARFYRMPQVRVLMPKD